MMRRRPFAWRAGLSRKSRAYESYRLDVFAEGFIWSFGGDIELTMIGSDSQTLRGRGK
jgi:hypothetical protein